MGNSESAPKLTQRQQDLRFLGDRCPFGDAELSHLYRAYQRAIVDDKTTKSNSFLEDWAVACLWSQQQALQKNVKGDNNDPETLEAKLDEWRTLIQVLEMQILPPQFGNRMYEAAFLAPGDTSVYANNKSEETAANPEASGFVDDYTRKARLESFFEGLSNCSRRGAKDSLKVVFDSCAESLVIENNSVKRVRAREFIEIGYRLALAAEFLREAQAEDENDAGMQAFLAPDDTSNDKTLMAFADSIVEQQKRRKRRQEGDFSVGSTAAVNENADGWVEMEDIVEWSEAVAPLFAYILQTLFHYMMFPSKANPSSRTQFAYPRIPDTSSFFASPNSSLLFTFGSLSSALSGAYYRLYTSEADGLSFNRLQNALLGYSGPTLLIIRAATDNGDGNNIFGAFTASPWKESKDFYGNTDCFLFQMAPLTAVYRPSGNGRNFMYCNSHARSRGYDKQAHGIGFGGSVDQPRLFIAESMDDCFAAPNQDMTFEHGSLLPLNPSGAAQKYFTVESLEVWGVGGDEVVATALGARDKAREIKAEGIRRARKVDKAQFLDDFRSGVVSSKAFKHRQEVDGRADQDLEDVYKKKYHDDN